MPARVTRSPAGPAALRSDTVKFAVPPPATLAVVVVIDSRVAGLIWRLFELLDDPKVALMVSVVRALTAEVVSVMLAEVAPAGMTTDPGTVTGPVPDKLTVTGAPVA
jgi:hypothetical protein